jgi:dTDP-4-dehydrorhamnose reductase
VKILVTGATGMLGQKLVEVFRAAGHDVVATARRGVSDDVLSLDITDVEQVARQLVEERPDVVVNAAAYTAVDRCEDEEDLAWEVNAGAPGMLASACLEIEARFVHISTDYVFDGESDRPYLESDPPAPRSAYGRTKLSGEVAVREAGGRWMIARVQWLYGEHGPNFAETMLRLASEHPRLRVVDDQFGSPTYTGDVARQLLDMIEADARGVFHVTNEGEVSWCGFARAVLERAGLGDHPVDAISTEEFPRPAPRPRYSVLANGRLDESGRNLMRPWPEALDEYMLRRSEVSRSD